MDLPIPGVPLRDPVAAVTHLAAAVFAAYAATLLCRLAGADRVKRRSMAVFGATAVVLYAASGVYHAVPLPRESATVGVFRRLDHSAIYLLIAGTYTPVFSVLLTGRRRAILLTMVWLAAALGVAAKWLFSAPPEWFEIGIYVGLGWLAVVVAAALVRAVGLRGMGWAVGGGMCYSAGAAFELARWPVMLPGLVGWHEVLHVCVMAGTGLHGVFMVRCVIPFRRSGPSVDRLWAGASARATAVRPVRPRAGPT
ncbi:MAG TPA: hemolysin III family protein [Gemmataceae bacterium]|nr:hemolysin III family protein [Gemmataceae bacterium]